MKICTNCKEEKQLSDFHEKKSENRVSSWCKICVYSLQKTRWKDRKRKAIELLGGKCNICGYNKNLAALHFHHLNPKEKEFDWSKLRLIKWENVIKELKKCIVVCANCHAEIHSPDNNLILIHRGKHNVNLDRKNEIKSTGKCPVCSEDVYGTRYCSTQCSKIGSRKVKRPETKLLLELLKTNSYCKVGKIFGVSDNAIRKWIKSGK